MLAFVASVVLSTSPHGGTLSQALISAALQLQFPRLAACLERSHAKPEGRVVAHVVIAVDGRVKRVKLSEAATASPAAVQCVLMTMKAMKTAPPVGGTVEVTLPFEFDSREQ